MAQAPNRPNLQHNSAESPAMRLLIATVLTLALLTTEGAARLSDALLRTKAAAMARDYHRWR